MLRGEEIRRVAQIGRGLLPGADQERGEARLALVGDAALVRFLVSDDQRKRDAGLERVERGLSGERNEDPADAEIGEERRAPERLRRSRRDSDLVAGKAELSKGGVDDRIARYGRVGD